MRLCVHAVPADEDSLLEVEQATPAKWDTTVASCYVEYVGQSRIDGALGRMSTRMAAVLNHDHEGADDTAIGGGGIDFVVP